MDLQNSIDMKRLPPLKTRSKSTYIRPPIVSEFSAKQGHMLLVSKTIPAKRLYAIVTQHSLIFYDKDTNKVKELPLAKSHFKGFEGLQISAVTNGGQQIRMKFEARSERDSWLGVLTRMSAQTAAQNMEEEPIALSFQSPAKSILQKRQVPAGHIEQKDFLLMTQTADLLLFKCPTTVASIQRIMTNSDYDHIGFVIVFKPGDVRVVHVQEQFGVEILCWPDHKAKYKYSEIAHRRLDCHRDRFFDRTLDFVKNNLGKKYQLSVAKLLVNRTFYNNAYFCSELVAKLYKTLGLLGKEKSSNKYWPVDFTSKKNIGLLYGKLEKEKVIDLAPQ